MSKKIKRHKRYLITACIAVVLLIASVVAYFVPPRRLLPALKISPIGEGELRLHFLSIGEGDCSIAEFPDGEVFVIDSGTGDFDKENKLIRYLKGLHPTRINMILTHADADHYGGFTVLLKNFKVEKFYLPVLSSEDEKYTRLSSEIAREGCETETLMRYHTIGCTGGYFVCLSPHTEGETDKNDSSAVLFLHYGNFRALFCADVSSVREKQLVREYSLDETIFDSDGCSVDLSELDLLKVAHHGSAGSSSQELLQLIRPASSIISCGVGNGYKFPREETLARIREANPDGKIYRLDDTGDLIVTVNAENYRVEAREQ